MSDLLKISQDLRTTRLLIASPPQGSDGLMALNHGGKSATVLEWKVARIDSWVSLDGPVSPPALMILRGLGRSNQPPVLSFPR